MDIVFVTIPVQEIGRIAPLWEKLNAQHGVNSKNFREHYISQTFEVRCAKFRVLSGCCVHIGAAQAEGGTLVGYCVCTLEDGAGELDSIYVEAGYRTRGIGRRLAEDGVKWLIERGCRSIAVAVADGNESAFGFYERLGFRVRKTILQLAE